MAATPCRDGKFTCGADVGPMQMPALCLTFAACCAAVRLKSRSADLSALARSDARGRGRGNAREARVFRCPCGSWQPTSCHQRRPVGAVVSPFGNRVALPLCQRNTHQTPPPPRGL